MSTAYEHNAHLANRVVVSFLEALKFWNVVGTIVKMARAMLISWRGAKHTKSSELITEEGLDVQGWLDRLTPNDRKSIGLLTQRAFSLDNRSLQSRRRKDFSHSRLASQERAGVVENVSDLGVGRNLILFVSHVAGSTVVFLLILFMAAWTQRLSGVASMSGATVVLLNHFNDFAIYLDVFLFGLLTATGVLRLLVSIYAKSWFEKRDDS